MKQNNKNKIYSQSLNTYKQLLNYYKYAVSNYKCSKYKPYLMYYMYMIGDLQQDVKRIKINLNKLKRKRSDNKK